MDAKAPEVTLVIPCYRSKDTIRGVVERVLHEFRGLAVQVVLVDDGNDDGTEGVVSSLGRELPHCVTAARLARNFGEHNAVMAGLRLAAGAYIVVMDDDGQHSAEDARRLYEEARSGGFDLVYSQFVERHHSAWRVLGSRFNGWVARLLLDAPEGLYLSSFKCMSRWLCREVRRYDGPFPYVDGLALRATRSIGKVAARHHPRLAGSSGYDFRRLMRLWLCVATSFSIVPLRVASALGFATTVLGAALGAQVVFERFSERPPAGWSYLAVVVLLTSGVQLLLLGVIGEYLGRLFLIAGGARGSALREVVGYKPAVDAAEPSGHAQA